jgi:amino acid transporter
MTRLADLWAGRLPLSTAFWSYAVFWGFFINVAALAVSLIAVMAASPSGVESQWNWAIYFAVLAHVLPIPFNAMVLVGVWRSAERPENPPLQSLAAKLAIAAWAVALFMAYLIIP